MIGSGRRRSILAIGTLGLLLAPDLAAAQPIRKIDTARDAAAAASDAAVAASEAATRAATMPHFPRSNNEPNYQVEFQIKSDKAKSLIAEHKKMCESLGPSRCKVDEFSPERGEYGHQRPTLKLRLAPGSAPALIVNLGKLRSDVGFKVHEYNPSRRAEHNRAELTVRKALLLAQQEKLNVLQASAPADQQDVISNQFSQIRAQVTQVDRELAADAGKSTADVVTIRYDDPSQSHPSRASRKFDEMFTAFGLALLAVTGIALLTILYFAIMGLGFLWVRRFARRRGLLGNAASSNQKPAS